MPIMPLRRAPRPAAVAVLALAAATDATGDLARADADVATTARRSRVRPSAPALA